MADDGFPRPRLDAGGSSGGFSSPKPKPSDPTDVIYKSGNIRGDPSEIWWDSARFEEIQANFGDFWCRSIGVLQIPANFLKIPVTIWCIFAQISWVLQKSGDDLMFFCLDLVIFAQIRWRFGEKYRSPSNGISSSIIVGFNRFNRRCNNSNLTWPVGVCGQWQVFLRKPDVIGLVLGWAQTRLGPTCGHPYNQLSALINLGDYNSYQRTIPIKR